MAETCFDSIDRSHQLFRRHKHHLVDYEAVVSFPPGTGGNFLTVRDGTSVAAIPDTNFYIGRLSHHLFLDDSPWTQPLDLDMLDRSLYINPGLPALGCTVGRCHNLPWLTSNVFTMHVDELVVLNLRADDAWYADALSKIKTFFNTDWNSMPDMMYAILFNAKHDGEVKVGEYRTICDAVSRRYGVDCTNTVISWRHYMECKLHGLPLDDTDVFERIVSNLVFTTLTEGVCEGLDEYSSIWRGDVFEQQLGDMDGIADAINQVDYRDLMISGLSTRSPYLSAIPRPDIARYTASNLDLVGRWLPCCHPDIAEEGYQRLARLRTLFDQAAW